ncbi:MAG: sugar ABC transporter permease [Candidatus Izimaplasma sp.]|nr:sugar ABC transporter permease [Candidatus Izimaplasma bacterium]
MNEIKKINPVLRYFLVITSMFRTNIRDYGMYIALTVIFMTFAIMTNGLFLGPINFTNLLNQTAYVSVLAIGMTLVIVTRQIDLSVGFLGAFLGAYVVVAVENRGTAIPLALLSALVITIIVGIIKGFFVAKIKVPSFVITLAGMFIFKGFLMIRTNNRTIPTSNEFFNKIGVGYLSTAKIGNLDMITFIMGILIVIFLVLSSILKRRKNNKLGIENESLQIYITKTVFVIGILLYIAFNLASYRGISYLLLITLVVMVIYFFFTTKTTLGRRIYAVGGNPEAAELSGIKVTTIIIIVFISMGILALVSGVMYASYVQNTSPNHGPFWELYAIAATFIGGASASGGVGKIVNSLIGSVVIMSLKNGMALAGFNSNIEPIVLGSVLLLAVVFDIYTRNVRPVDLVGMYYARKKYREEYIEAKQGLKTAKKKLAAAKKAGEALIEYEYELTNAKSQYSRIKNMIRSSNEEDYQDMIKV